MLAHASLAVTAARESSQHPAPDKPTALACNKIQHLYARLVARPTHAPATDSAGPIGGATKPEHGPAITDGKPSQYEDHDLTSRALGSV
jgi:hypothetical protein